MEGGTFLCNADAFAFNAFQAGKAIIIGVCCRNKCGRREPFFFAAFIGNNCQLLAACRHVKEACGNAGCAYINLRRSSCNGNGVCRVKPFRLYFYILFGKKAFVHGNKQRRAAGKAQHAELNLRFGRCWCLLFAAAAACKGKCQAKCCQ